MSEEEKRAIEELKVLIGLEEFNKLSYKENQSIKILLNLIEKQSKEIEELKMKLEVEKIDNKYNQEEACEEMIPRYKIKAKIEEYDKTLYYAETEEGMAELKDYEYDEAKYGKKVLKSLLEEE